MMVLMVIMNGDDGDDGAGYSARKREKKGTWGWDGAVWRSRTTTDNLIP
jgi:hypothetical protein